MIDNKYFILFLVVILLVFTIINYNLILEKENFYNYEDSNEYLDNNLSNNINIVGEEIESSINQVFAINRNKNNVSNVKQAYKSDPEKFLTKLKPNEIISNNSFINTQIKDAIKKEKENAEIIINNRNNIETTDYVSSEMLSDDKDSQDLKTMFEQLENMEYLCTNLERKNKLKDNLEQIKINEVAMKELKEQENQISELMGVVKQLRMEHGKRDSITSSCRGKRQQQLNADYGLVQNLSKRGLLKNEAINVNLDLGIEKKLNEFAKNGQISGNPISSLANELLNSNKKKCEASELDKKRWIHKDKLKHGVCMGCDVSKLVKNKPSDKTQKAFLSRHF